MKKKVAFCTLGCKVNQYETNAMIEQFINKGYELAQFEEFADIYIINTCTVTNMADRKSRQMLRRVKEINPKAILVACGCYAQVAKEELEKIEEIDLIYGTNEKNKIAEFIEDYIEEKKKEEQDSQEINSLKEKRASQRVSACRKTYKIQFRHAGRLLKKEQNFVFCERELYKGTAPEQKAKSTKNPENSMFSGFLI